MSGRGAATLVTLVALLLLTTAASRHADGLRARRASGGPDMLVVLRALPGPDLAIAGGARHLRSLTQAEPGAAFADGPAAIDDDPAGGVIAPPRDAWALEVTRGR